MINTFSLTTAVLVGFAFLGCMSKPKADRNARAAYLAGQQEALAQMQAQSTPATTQITIVGDVQNTTIDWQEGLTLAEAIVSARYLSERDPLQIIVFRRGQAIGVNPAELLRGRGDILLEPGDKIHIQR